LSKKNARPPRLDARANERISWKLTRYFKEKGVQTPAEANSMLDQRLSFEEVENLIKPETALEKAQDLVWRAFEETSKRKRISMAKDALKLSPDCADAYVLLAEDEAEDHTEVETLLRKGIEAGRRALGDSTVQNLEVDFWKDLETRPFMRAVDGLARHLQDYSRTEQAIELWLELLRLNPEDNLDVRIRLVPALVEMERFDEASKLIDQYKWELEPALLFSKALMLFKQKGDSDESRDELYHAMQTNRFVIPKLLNLDADLPDIVEDEEGTEEIEEAAATEYLTHNFTDWLDTEGAMDWLVTILERSVEQTKKKMKLETTFPGLRQVDTAPSILELLSHIRD